MSTDELICRLNEAEELLRMLDPERKGSISDWCPFCRPRDADFFTAPQHTEQCRLKKFLAAATT
jgi:hypothetical protein